MGEQQHRYINNDFAAHSDVDLYKGVHKLYYWGLLNYDKSYSLKINHRLQTGAGLAYNFIASPYLSFNDQWYNNLKELRGTGKYHDLLMHL